MPSVPRSEFYMKEQQEITQKILNILGIDENNQYVYLYDISRDTELQNKIYKLVPDIKRYYSASSWGVFNKTDYVHDHKYLNIARAVLVHSGYRVISKQTTKVIDNTSRSTQRYLIEKIENTSNI